MSQSKIGHDAVRIGGIELAVVELQVVVHDGHAAHGAAGGRRGARGSRRSSAGESSKLESCHRFAHPSTWRSTNPAGRPRSPSSQAVGVEARAGRPSRRRARRRSRRPTSRCPRIARRDRGAHHLAAPALHHEEVGAEDGADRRRRDTRAAPGRSGARAATAPCTRAHVVGAGGDLAHRRPAQHQLVTRRGAAGTSGSPSRSGTGASQGAVGGRQYLGESRAQPGLERRPVQALAGRGPARPRAARLPGPPRRSGHASVDREDGRPS